MEKPIIETPKKHRQQPDISPPKFVDHIKKRGLDCEHVEEETVKRIKKECPLIEDENNEHAHVVFVQGTVGKENKSFFFEDGKLVWEAPKFQIYSGWLPYDHPEIAILANSIQITFDLVKIRFVGHSPKGCYHQNIKCSPCNGKGVREADMLNFFSELASIIKKDRTSIPKEVGLCFYETDIAEIKQKLSEDDMKVLVEHFGWSV